MDHGERLAAVEVQTRGNKEDIVALTKEIKEEVKGLRTEIGTVQKQITYVRSDIKAGKASGRTLWAAFLAIAGLVGFIVNLYMHKGGG